MCHVLQCNDGSLTWNIFDGYECRFNVLECPLSVFNLIARMVRYDLNFYRYSLSCICMESNECVLVNYEKGDSLSLATITIIYFYLPILVVSDYQTIFQVTESPFSGSSVIPRSKMKIVVLLSIFPTLSLISSNEDTLELIGPYPWTRKIPVS